MPINFFEKMVNVAGAEEIKSKISTSGDVVAQFKGK